MPISIGLLSTQDARLHAAWIHARHEEIPCALSPARLGGDETEWQRFAQPENLLDNMIADGKAVPMVPLMPNGRAQPDDHPTGNMFAHAAAFANFDGWWAQRVFQ